MRKLKKNMKIIWAGRLLSVIAILPFVMSAVMKLTANPQVTQGMAHLGLPKILLARLAILEVLCIVTYLVPVTSILGAILFTGYVGGTIITHLRVGESVLLQIALGIVIWLGLYLREPRLREILPLAQPLQ